MITTRPGTALLCLLLSVSIPAQEVDLSDVEKAVRRLDRVQRSITAIERLLQREQDTASLKRAQEELSKLRRRLGVLVARGDEAQMHFPAVPQEKVRAAVADGLLWLRLHQDENGRWDSDEFMKHDKQGKPCDGDGNPVQDIGNTGLVVLAMLADGSTLQKGPHKEHLRKAVRFLIDQQGGDGRLGPATSHDFIYGHAIGTWALAEAAASSKLIRAKAQAALNYLEWHRNPYAVWRYQPRDNDNDTSVTAWCAHALLAGKRGGMEINPTALKVTQSFLDEITDPQRGTAGYTKRGEPSSRNPGDHAQRFPANPAPLSAAALGIRAALGQRPDKIQVMTRTLGLLRRYRPHPHKPKQFDHYYWFHGTLALRQLGGPDFENWGRALAATALGEQRRDGNAKGSWDPKGVWGKVGGRVYSTALMCLSLRLLEQDCKFGR